MPELTYYDSSHKEYWALLKKRYQLQKLSKKLKKNLSRFAKSNDASITMSYYDEAQSNLVLEERGVIYFDIWNSLYRPFSVDKICDVVFLGESQFNLDELYKKITALPDVNQKTLIENYLRIKEDNLQLRRSLRKILEIVPDSQKELKECVQKLL